MVIVDLISRNDPYFAVKWNHYLIARGTRNRYRSIHRLLYIIFLFLKEILLVFSLYSWTNNSRIICYDRISRSTSKRETMETRNKSFNLCKNFDRACTIPPSRLKFLRVRAWHWEGWRACLHGHHFSPTGYCYFTGPRMIARRKGTTIHIRDNRNVEPADKRTRHTWNPLVHR